MRSLYQILKSAKLGAGAAPDFRTAIMAQKMPFAKGSGAEHEYTGAVPVTFTANGQPLLDYLISGNMSQTGTPSPSTPIQPQECGDKTANLWDNLPNKTTTGVTLSSNGGVISFSGIASSSINIESTIELTAGTYTLKANANRNPSTNNNACIQVYNGSAQLYAKVNNDDAMTGSVTFTINEDLIAILRIRLQNGVDYTGFELRPTLNIGNTAIPFEPFGYKIPISSAGQTTPVYLGEVETTRMVKKLVLTGQETWYFYKVTSTIGYGIHQFYTQNMSINSMQYSSCYSNITPYGMTSNTRNAGEYGCYVVSSGQEIGFQMIGVADTIPDVPTWKQYLAEQYASGTPVCVWYILATPQTEVVNEPLRKIGDYADTLSMEQTGVQIPTVRGTNTLDVLTDVKPSEVYIKYKS